MQLGEQNSQYIGNPSAGEFKNFYLVVSPNTPVFYLL
jgi:hypothetical protein